MEHRVEIAIAVNGLVRDDDRRPVSALILPLLILSFWLPVAEAARAWAWAWEQAGMFGLGLVVIVEALFVGGVYWRLRWAG